MSIEQSYQRWLKAADASLLPQLQAMDEAAREDAFYRDLSFGTGGLRGVIGPGTNRMNVHTVAKASQGLADYVAKRFLYLLVQYRSSSMYRMLKKVIIPPITSNISSEIFDQKYIMRIPE